MARILDNAIDPFEIDQDYYYQPRHFLPRLAAQSSFFTISSNPLQLRWMTDTDWLNFKVSSLSALQKSLLLQMQKKLS